MADYQHLTDNGSLAALYKFERQESPIYGGLIEPNGFAADNTFRGKGLNCHTMQSSRRFLFAPFYSSA